MIKRINRYIDKRNIADRTAMYVTILGSAILLGVVADRLSGMTPIITVTMISVLVMLRIYHVRNQ